MSAEKDPLESSLEQDVPDVSESLNLVQRAQGGDATALNELLKRYQDRLRRIVRVRIGARLRPHVESVEIVDDAFMVAARKIRDFTPESPASMLHWLAKIAENKIRDADDFHFKAEKRDRRREEPLQAPTRAGESKAVPREFAADITSPEDGAFRREVRELLDEGLATLTEEHREVILLRDYCGAEWEFVMRELGRETVPATRELHRRAWMKLRRAVRPKLDGLTRRYD